MLFGHSQRLNFQFVEDYQAREASTMNASLAGTLVLVSRESF
jgi:hypothetical protein